MHSVALVIPHTFNPLTQNPKWTVAFSQFVMLSLLNYLRLKYAHLCPLTRLDSTRDNGCWLYMVLP